MALCPWSPARREAGAPDAATDMVPDLGLIAFTGIDTVTDTDTPASRWSSGWSTVSRLTRRCPAAHSAPHDVHMTMSRKTLRRRTGLVVLFSAFASFVLSVTLWFTGSHDQGLFVGLWVPSILSLGTLALQLAGTDDE